MKNKLKKQFQHGIRIGCFPPTRQQQKVSLVAQMVKNLPAM